MTNVAKQLDDIRQAALQAFEDDDYVNARKAATKALLIISTIPDGSLAGLSSQTWNRSGVLEFIAQIDRLEASADTASSGGMVLQNYSYSGRRSC